MSPEVKEEMQKARSYIQLGLYQQAYDILVWIDDPKAEEWLEKIEPKLAANSKPTIEPEKPKRAPEFKPWNPRFFWVFYFFGILGLIASFILSLNWKRLGKPEWVLPSILIVVGIPITAFILVGSFFLSAYGGVNTSNLVVGVGALALLLTIYLLPISLQWMQLSAYKTWQEKGNQALLEHDYHLKRTLGVVASVFVVVLIGGGFFFSYYFTPVEYESDFIRLQYQRTWTVEDPNDFEFCSYSWNHCEIVLGEGDYVYTGLAIQKVTLDAPTTAQELADLDLQYYSTLPDFENGGQDIQMIDGQEAIRSYLNYDVDDGRIAQIEMYLVRGDVALQISTWSGCGGCLREDMDKIMQVVDSIEFVD